MLAAACGRPDKAEPLLRHLMDTGVDEHAPGEATLGRILAARVTEGRKHVVVLDFVAPYVKVFNGEGRFVRAFLKEGAGPGEARYPVALAVSGDSLILVADVTGRMRVLTLDGRVQAEATPGGFLPLAVAAGCNGEWIVYGPNFRGSGTAPTWLRRIRFDRGTPVAGEETLRDTIGSSAVPQGVAYGMVTTGGATWTWHTLGRRNALARWRCGASTPEIVAREAAPDLPRSKHEGGSVARLELHAGSRARGGLAVVGGRGMVAEQVMGQNGEWERTEFSLLTPGGRARSFSLPGGLEFRDSRPGVGVLMSSDDPLPHVFLIPERSLLAGFRP